MSEENNNTIQSLHAEISRLNTELAETRAEARKSRIAKKQLAEDHNKLKSDHDQLFEAHQSLKNRQGDPSAVEKELAELKKVVTTKAHREVFDHEAKDLGIRAEALEQVYQLSGYQPGEGDPDTAQIKTTLTGLLETSPWFKSEAEAKTTKAAPKQQLVAGPGLERGSPAFTDMFTVRDSDLQNPNWMMVNQKNIAKYGREGKLNWISGQ